METVIATAIEKGGAIVFLVIAIIVVWRLYIHERHRNEKLFSDLMQFNKEMVEALMGMQTVVGGFKEALNSVREAIKEHLCTDQSARDDRRGGRKS